MAARGNVCEKKARRLRVDLLGEKLASSYKQRQRSSVPDDLQALNASTHAHTIHQQAMCVSFVLLCLSPQPKLLRHPSQASLLAPPV